MYNKPGKRPLNLSGSREELIAELRALDEKYNTIIDSMDIALTLVDAHTLERADGNIHFAALLGYTLEEFHYITPEEMLVNAEQSGLSKAYREILTTGSATYTNQFRRKDGSVLDFATTSRLIWMAGHQYILSTGRDITELTKAQTERDKAYEELEIKVRERTRELCEKTQKLEREILKRQTIEKELLRNKEELSRKNHSLEEMNTALTILLKKRDEEKSETEENMVSNIKRLIDPYLKQLQKTHLTTGQQSLISMVESNLKEVTSPYLHHMFNDKYSIFTPREIQIVNLIKVGKSTKEIAEILHSGTGTVEHHRKNIRKKLGLNNKSTNLRSYLLSK